MTRIKRLARPLVLGQYFPSGQDELLQNLQAYELTESRNNTRVSYRSATKSSISPLTLLCVLVDCSKMPGMRCHASGWSWNCVMTCWASCCCTRYETRLQLHKALMTEAKGRNNAPYLLSRAGVKHIHDTIQQRNIRFFRKVEKSLSRDEAISYSKCDRSRVSE